MIHRWVSQPKRQALVRRRFISFIIYSLRVWPLFWHTRLFVDLFTLVAWVGICFQTVWSSSQCRFRIALSVRHRCGSLCCLFIATEASLLISRHFLINELLVAQLNGFRFFLTCNSHLLQFDCPMGDFWLLVLILLSHSKVSKTYGLFELFRFWFFWAEGVAQGQDVFLRSTLLKDLLLKLFLVILGEWRIHWQVLLRLNLLNV